MSEFNVCSTFFTGKTFNFEYVLSESNLKRDIYFELNKLSFSYGYRSIHYYCYIIWLKQYQRS